MERGELIITLSVITVTAVFWEELKAETGALKHLPFTPT